MQAAGDRKVVDFLKILFPLVKCVHSFTVDNNLSILSQTFPIQRFLVLIELYCSTNAVSNRLRNSDTRVQDIISHPSLTLKTLQRIRTS